MLHPRNAGPPTRLAMETMAYQTLLEGHRHDPDNELIYEDMLKAKAAMEVAWLEVHPTSISSPGSSSGSPLVPPAATSLGGSPGDGTGTPPRAKE